MSESTRDTTEDEGDWVSVPLGDGTWEARCRVEPRRGRPAIIELHVRPARGSEPTGSIDQSLLRTLRKTDIAAEFARQRHEDSAGQPVNDTLAFENYEDLLALVAITYEEHLSAGSRCPSKAVWEFLTTLHEISHDKRRDPSLREGDADEPWQWGDRARIRKYTYSGARTLVREARIREYLNDDGTLSQGSATATLKLAAARRSSYDEGVLEDALDMREWVDAQSNC
jgi:hypothetical protein